MAKLSRNIRDPKPPRGWHVERTQYDHKLYVRDGYHLEACPGEAHSNPHIDHCGTCMPRWGIIAVPNEPKPES